jgi:cell wall-associated NlpC family hydrolase
MVRSWARRWPLPAGAAIALCLTTTAAGRPMTGQPGSATPPGLASSASPDQPLAAAVQRAALAAQAQARAMSQDGITQTGLEPGGGLRSAAKAVTVASLSGAARPAVAPLRRLRPADLLVVAPAGLPGGLTASIGRLRGVAAAERIDAARIRLGGKQVAVLGVRPSSFRAFAARPTAKATRLWQGVAAGGIAVSYTMGKQDRLPVGQGVRVTGARTERLRVAGYGTVGIAGVDAVVSDPVARSLGIPAGNAIVISAPHADLSSLIHAVGRLLPRQAVVAPLVAQSRTAASAGPASPLPAGQGVTGPGAAGAPGVTAADGPGLSSAQVSAFLAAAESRVGLPYVWGGSGPLTFDCSGLVQWSLARAGIVMPRVAVDQARTGPQVAVSQLQPGDLLFYHTDPTAPQYISHVAIYLGGGRMIQAPEPGEDVEIVPAVTSGPGFAGAVGVYPRLAAAVAASLPG